ncbi:MAG: hypothetical protein WA324_27505 [Bryobacteraceae bacterium]
MNVARAPAGAGTFAQLAEEEQGQAVSYGVDGVYWISIWNVLERGGRFTLML